MSRDTTVKDDTYSAVKAMVLREERSGWHVCYVLRLEYEPKSINDGMMLAHRSWGARLGFMRDYIHSF